MSVKKVVDSELRTESGVAAEEPPASPREEHTALVGLDKFQRMNPTVFGAIQIAIGIFMVLLIAIWFLTVSNFLLIVPSVFWGIIIYIPAGAMVIATGKKLTKAMVVGTLVLNVLAALSAVAGFQLHLSLLLRIGYPGCVGNCHLMQRIEIVMMVLTIVLFIDAIVVVGFAVAALCSSKKHSNEPTVI